MIEVVETDASPKTRWEPASVALLAVWQLLSALALALVITHLRMGAWLRELSGESLMYVSSLVLAHLMASVGLGWKILRGSEFRLRDAVLMVSAAYSIWGFVWFLGSFITATSKSVLVLALFVSYVLASLPAIVKPRHYKFLVPALVVVVGGLFFIRRDVSGADRSGTEEQFQTTAFYNLRLTMHLNVIRSEARGGAVEPFGAGFMVASGDGSLYYLEDKTEGAFTARILPYHVPMNRGEFMKNRLAGVPDYEFRVADIMIRPDGERFRLFASHHYWNTGGACSMLRLSQTEATFDDFLDGSAQLEWKTVYDTKPCLVQKPTRFPFSGEQVGGRMVELDNQTILLTVGDQLYDGWNSELNLPQDASADWGKTIRINVESGVSEIYTTGHRNPQGLHRLPNGEIWSTEHGPRGGDELNLLVQGANHGWPFVTYGTDYGLLSWPLSQSQGRHTGYEPPVFSWVPSIGISSLTSVQHDLFDLWRGDLLLASLREQTVFRIRLEKQRVGFIEPLIKVAGGIRDMVEGPDGRIILFLDRGDIGFIEPLLTAPNPEDPDYRSHLSELLLGGCKGCHPVGDGSTHGIGPDLGGIVGREIASAPGYDYSPALRNMSGAWTKERLNEFLADPRMYAPGNFMDVDGIVDPTARTILIDHLATPQ